MAKTSRIRDAYRRLLPYLARYRRAVLLIVILGAVASIGTKANLFLLKPLVNLLFQVPEPQEAGTVSEEPYAPLSNWDTEVLVPALESIPMFGLGPQASAAVLLTLFLLLSSAVFALLQFLFLKLSRMLGIWLITDLRQHLAEHVLSLGMRFHTGRRLGDLLSRLTTDVGTSLRMLNLVVEELIQEPFAIVASLTLAFMIAPLATLGMLLFLPILALPVIKLGPRVRRRSAKSLQKLGDTSQSLTQMFTGIRVVKAFRMEEREAQEFKNANQEFIRQTERMVKTQATSLAITAFLASGGVGVVVGLIAIVNMKVPLFADPGGVTVFFLAIGSMFNSVKRLTKAVSVIQSSVGAADRVFEVFDLRPDIEDTGEEKPLNEPIEEIRFAGVGFSYQDVDAPALSGIECTIKQGERVALVGSSGAGKSTFLDLVARFYDPSQGAILVNGADLRHWRMNDWLDRLAVVSQQPFLFQTTLRENIRYGRQNATEAELRQACRAAYLDDFVQSLPEGLDTHVGDAGARLSGGQAQRVTIARALIKDAEVLLLDEATSALDSESERKVQHALENLMEGRTTFVIAHRLSTIRAADRIIVLEKGRIVEAGRHHELLEAGGHYARMWKLQSESEVLQN